jgi:SSS family solute:Na+ symporter
MPKSLHLADHIVIVGYFLLLTSIGIYFWRRMRHARDFFVGNNDVPWWLSGVSFYMTGFSAFTFIAYSEMAYRHGFVAVTLAWSAAVAMAVGTAALAARWRRARIITPVEFLEARYSRHIRQVLAWAGLPLRIIDDGLKIYATGVFVSVGMGYDLKVSIVGSGVVMLLYTFMGGLWAVIVTDYVQFIVLTIGVTTLFPLVLGRLGEVGALGLGAQAGFMSPVNAPFSALYVAAFYLLVLLSYNGNWAFAQKFYCVRDERAARKAGALGVVLKIVGPPLFILPALAARTLMPELMEPPNSPQYTYAALAVAYLPAGLMGLMIAAMFSATMSTLSGDYNAMASVLTGDVYHRIVNPRAGERQLVLVGRLTTALVGGLTILVAMALVETARKGLFEVMVAVFGLFVGPMLIPMLAGLVNRRVTWRGAAAGIAAGFASGTSLFLFKNLVLAERPGVDPAWLRYDFEAIMILTNIGVTIAAMMIVTLRERATAADREQIAAFFERLDTPVRLDPTRGGTASPAASPFSIIAAVTLGTGLLLWAAAAVQPGGEGRMVNVAAGLALAVLAAALWHLHHRLTRSAPAIAVSVE